MLVFQRCQGWEHGPGPGLRRRGFPSTGSRALDFLSPSTQGSCPLLRAVLSHGPTATSMLSPVCLDATARTSPAFPFHLSPTAYRTSQDPGIPRAERESVESVISALHQGPWKPGRVTGHFHNNCLKGLDPNAAHWALHPRLLLALPAPRGLSRSCPGCPPGALAAARASAGSAQPS